MTRESVENIESYFKDLKKELEEQLEALSEVTEYPSQFCSIEAIAYIDLQYNNSLLVKLLEEQEYVKDVEEAIAFVNAFYSDNINRLMKPLLEKQLNQRIKFINEHINDFQITKDDIIGRNDKIKYEELDIVIRGLTYEEIDPLILLEDFMSFYSIYITTKAKEDGIFYRFTSETPINMTKEQLEQWYHCNTLYEMIEHFSNVLLDGVTNYIVESAGCKRTPIDKTIYDTVDKRILSACKGAEEIYDYLKTKDIARMNLPLHEMHLLLN